MTTPADEDAVTSILSEYDQLRETFVAMGPVLEGLVGQCLAHVGIRPHVVTHRVKTRESLQKKVSRGESEYASLADVTDVVGVRVITFFQDEVDRAAQVLTPEFQIDEENSVDKREALDVDRFGYLSVHYVAEMLKTRTRFTEYKAFSGLKFEIQIRSILQHAWAEIEHDLGYKAAEGIPRGSRRAFSRVAGLLEVADDEFVRVRDELRRYESEVNRLIVSERESLSVDVESLTAFVTSSEIVHNIDTGLTSGAEVSYAPEQVRRAVPHDVGRLEFIGLRSIADVERELRVRHELILEFAKLWLGGRAAANRPGISLFYLVYAILGERGDLKHVQEYFRTMRIALRNHAASDVIRLYKEAKLELGEQSR